MSKRKFKKGQMVCRYVKTSDPMRPYKLIIGHIIDIIGTGYSVLWYNAWDLKLQRYLAYGAFTAEEAATMLFPNKDEALEHKED